MTESKKKANSDTLAPKPRGRPKKGVIPPALLPYIEARRAKAALKKKAGST